MLLKEVNQKEYIDILFEKKQQQKTKQISHEMKRIQSKSHEIDVYNSKKISLLCIDDKRYIFDDGIKTLAFKHKSISYFV